MFKKYPLVAASARNGLVAGILALLLLLTLFLVGRHPLFIPIFIDVRIILFVVLMSFTLYEYRKYYGAGELSFWEGMIMCIVLTVVFAVTCFIGLLIFGSVQPSFVSEYIALRTAELNAYPPAEIDKIGRKTFEYYRNAIPATSSADLAIQYLSQSFALSFFISIIISLILRRHPVKPT